MKNLQKSQLRQTLRAKRSQLSTAEQELAAQKLADLLLHSSLFITSTQIAFYFAINGEINPNKIIQAAWHMGKTCYLPSLTDQQQLQFCRYQQDDPVQKNRYGIFEPIDSANNLILPQQLDLVLVPLVAFDTKGNRLGMGAGYYDRTFAFLQGQPQNHQPLFIGLGYEFQRVENLTPEPWDVKLDGIVTEVGMYGVNEGIGW